MPLLGAQAQPAPDLPSPEARRFLLEGHGLPSLQIPEPPGSESLQDDYDVLHYELDILVDPARELIDGTCTITLRSLVGSLGLVELDLHHPEFVVRSAERRDRPGTGIEIFRDGDKLLLELAGERPGPNDEITIEIDYVGRPRHVPGGSPAVSFETDSVTGHARIHSFAEPNNARGWWPCKDRPDDKATLELQVEAPQALQVVSNGVLRMLAPGGDGFRVTRWVHEHPIAPYLVSFSAANYARWTEPWDYQDERGVGRRMTVSYYSWPELAPWAYQDFARTLPMLDALGERFGTYPFADEKYAIVMFGEDGGMEHQTATSIGGSLVALSRGSGAIENVLVHELAHQWWGDHVGITDFESIWLKEGLATWTEAIWWEENGGLEAYLAYMEDISRPLGGVEFPGTVHAPEDLFSQTVYFKGAWIVHMLRFLLDGSSPEASAGPVSEYLRGWADAKGGSHASTADFVAYVSERAAEDPALSGDPLHEWFFPQWLERDDRPRYALDFASHAADSGSGWTTHVRVEQRQEGGPYAMPVHLRLHSAAGPVADRVVFIGSEQKDLTLWTEEQVIAVELDPEGWLLKERVEQAEIDVDDDGWPDWLDPCPEVPDPEQRDDNENGIPDACEPGLDFDEDGWPNEEDCAPADAGAWSAPKRDTLLFVTKEVGNWVRLHFEHPPAEEQRAYVADVAIGALATLRADRSMRAASCLADDHPGEQLETNFGFASLGTYWVATPHNGCPLKEPEPTRGYVCP